MLVSKVKMQLGAREHSGVWRTHKHSSSSQAGLMQGPINKDVTLRNAAAFPTAKSGWSEARSVLCWLGFLVTFSWVIKMISSKSLPMADDELEKQ